MVLFSSNSKWFGIFVLLHVIFISYVFYLWYCLVDSETPVMAVRKGSASLSKTIGIYMCTWNVAECDSVDLSGALDLQNPLLPEVYAIGLQEVNTSHAGTGSGTWSAALTEILAPKGYVRLKERSMQGIVLVVFVQRIILPYTTNIESEITKTGFSGMWGNKGGVSVRLDIYGMNMIIVNSHLAAHQEKLQERIEDYDSVIDDQKFKDEDVDNILDHDYVFWIGDLNFRLNDISREEVLKEIKEKDYVKLLKHDQLLSTKKEGLIFDEFNEGDITFPPTYKFDKNTDVYDTSPKNRIPAWTDRILYYHHDVSYGNVRLDIKQKHYHSHPAFKLSDHKPVTSLCHVQVFPRPPPHGVTFRTIQPFHRYEDNRISYTVHKSFQTTYNDWIGLYKIDFKSFDEYQTYIWAFAGGEYRDKGVTLKFLKSYMTIPPGYYCLIYLTKNNSIHGISHTFEVLP